jgi:hypothetical protein
VDLLSTQFHDFGAGTKAGESRKGCLDHVGVITGTEGFGKDVTDADCFEYSSDTTTGDHTGTW